MIDELKQWEYDKGYTKGQIDILEKIKAEMDKDRAILFYDTQKVEILNEWIEKLDKHIAELKETDKDNWFTEMEEAEKRKEHEEWIESLEKGEKLEGLE